MEKLHPNNNCDEICLKEIIISALSILVILHVNGTRFVSLTRQ